MVSLRSQGSRNTIQIKGQFKLPFAQIKSYLKYSANKLFMNWLNNVIKFAQSKLIFPLVECYTWESNLIRYYVGRGLRCLCMRVTNRNFNMVHRD